MKFQKEFALLREGHETMRRTAVSIKYSGGRFEIGRKSDVSDDPNYFDITYAKHIKNSRVNGRDVKVVTGLLPIEAKLVLNHISQ